MTRRPTRPARPPRRLAPGASITCTATYTVTQADLDAGSVTNIATPPAATSPATRRDASPRRPTPLTIDADPEPDPDHRQDVDHDRRSRRRDDRPYSYLVTNTGNVTLTGLAVTDDQHRRRLRSALTTSLAPGARSPAPRPTPSPRPTSTRGTVDQHRAPRTTDRGRRPATDSAAPSRSTQSPSLTLDKTITSGDPTTAVGGTLTYSYLVTNTGNVTLTALAVSDDNVDAAPVCAVDQPRPGRDDHLHRDLHGHPGRPRRRLRHQQRDRPAAPRPVATPHPGHRHATATADPEPGPDPRQDARPPLTYDSRRRGHHLQLPRHQHRQRHPHRAVHRGRRQGDRRAPARPRRPASPRATRSPARATYTVTQADLDAGSVTNTATASGSFTFGDDTARRRHLGHRHADHRRHPEPGADPRQDDSTARPTATVAGRSSPTATSSPTPATSP